METTWTLHPNLTWHDSTPLTSDDFVFSWRVYTSPALSVFKATPQDQIEEVQAPDPRTIVIRWKQTYADAYAIVIEDLDPLPRHLLEADFATVAESQDARDAFLGKRFWATEYVGTGPYRLTGWEPGSHLEGVAFDGHVFGRPRIDRLIVRFFADDNTVATNILSEAIHLTFGQALRFEQAAFLEREWTGNGRGKVHYFPTSTSTLSVQLRPEYQQVTALRDVRVRRALAHTIDKQTLVDALFEGKGRPADTYIGPEHAFYPEIDRVLAKYPYDPRQAEQIFSEVGFRRGGDGVYVSDAGDRIAPGLWVTSGSQTERTLAILTDSWKRVGVDIQPHVIPNAQARDNQVRSTFPGLLNYGISPGLVTSYETFIIRQVPAPETRWGGQNRGGWVHQDYDRTFAAFTTTLDRAERTQRLAELARMLSQELPNYPLMANLGAMTHLSVLKGPEAGTPETTPHWNVWEWELS
jgi:peptide/nickel transport system substrate-binding protein